MSPSAMPTAIRLDYVATVHHGIDTANFTILILRGPISPFFGRIHPDKGVVAAIDTAEEPGSLYGSPESFKTRRTSGRGGTPPGQRRSEVHRARPGRGSFRLPGRCCGPLHLISFDEPFGLLSSRPWPWHPVIAFDRGSCPRSSTTGDGRSGGRRCFGGQSGRCESGQFDRRRTVRDRGRSTVRLRPHGRRVRRCLSASDRGVRPAIIE